MSTLHISSVVAAYLIGAIPFGLLLTKALTSRDPREHGSGNIGATNAMRTGGKLVGILTMLADVAKSLVPVYLAILAEFPEVWIGAVATAAFVGHIFPIYLKFKGGKGVATMLGAILPWQPLAAVVGMLIWGLLLWVKGFVSLASVLAALLLPLLVYIFDGSVPALIVSMVFASLVTIKHRSNIRRLLNGTESSIRSDQSASSAS